MADDIKSVEEGRRRADVSRRELFKMGAAATVAASFALGKAAAARSSAAAAPPAGAQIAGAKKFFTADEFALVDELSEVIIPTDAHSPGARAAKVAAFIDFQLGEAWEEKDRTNWRDGLKTVNRISQEVAGKTFMQSTPQQRVATLTRMALNEDNPTKPEELFFKDLKSRVVYAYYSSEIGIHQEMEYKGNTYLTEFVGYDVTKPNG